MRSSREAGGAIIVGGLAALTGVLVLVAVTHAAGASQTPPVPVSAPQLSAGERAMRDSSARQDMANIATTSTFHTRLPAAPPAGYIYDHVTWDPAHPEQGFAIWMQPVASDVRGIHITEAPDVPTAAKDTLKLSGLTPVNLQNGRWMAIQKPDEPWQGLWIYATVLDGVHIEVDGMDRGTVSSVAGGL